MLSPRCNAPSRTLHREYVTTTPMTTGYVVQPHITHVVEPRVSYVQEPRKTIEYVPQLTYVAQERTTYETVPYTTYETVSHMSYDVQPIREQQTVLVEQQVPVYYQAIREQVMYTPNVQYVTQPAYTFSSAAHYVQPQCMVNYSGYPRGSTYPSSRILRSSHPVYTSATCNSLPGTTYTGHRHFSNAGSTKGVTYINPNESVKEFEKVRDAPSANVIGRIDAAANKDNSAPAPSEIVTPIGLRL